MEKQDNIIELILSLSKAEKRNFKLYATRQGGKDMKFIALFDLIDSTGECDEKGTESLGIKRQQIPNMKAHLYRQIMISLRLLEAQRSPVMQLHEQLDFAKILYDKGLYRQSVKILDKLQLCAQEINRHTSLLDIIEFERQIEVINISHESTIYEKLSRKTEDMCRKISQENSLANISLKLYSLYLKLGSARSQKDLDLIDYYFKQKLDSFKGKRLSFTEQVYYYQSMAWYSSIKHNPVESYRYAVSWVELFDSQPKMKLVMYDSYIWGYANILSELYTMRKYDKFIFQFEKFGKEVENIGVLNDNAYILSRQILYLHQLNRHFLEGSFSDGIDSIPMIKLFLDRYSNHLSMHNKMNFYYKIACLYFGSNQYLKCIEYLNKITSTKDHQIRRDLQCFAKILTLISSYEAGTDENLDSQIRSVYAFLVKMNDMQMVQKEMMGFLKRLDKIYVSELKSEFARLYERLLPYTTHTYERRAFYYLDIMSWLESKTTGRSVEEIIRDKFRLITKNRSK